MAISPVIAQAVSGDGAVLARKGNYHGFVFRETAGSTATVKIYDDPDSANGVLLDTVALAANESVGAYYDCGIRANTGIYVDVTGTVEGSVRFAG